MHEDLVIRHWMASHDSARHWRFCIHGRRSVVAERYSLTYRDDSDLPRSGVFIGVRGEAHQRAIAQSLGKSFLVLEVMRSDILVDGA